MKNSRKWLHNHKKGHFHHFGQNGQNWAYNCMVHIGKVKFLTSTFTDLFSMPISARECIAACSMSSIGDGGCHDAFLPNLGCRPGFEPLSPTKKFTQCPIWTLQSEWVSLLALWDHRNTLQKEWMELLVYWWRSGPCHGALLPRMAPEWAPTTPIFLHLHTNTPSPPYGTKTCHSLHCQYSFLSFKHKKF